MVSNKPISESMIIASVPSAVSDVCKPVLAELEANNFSQEDSFAVHLAIEEAFLNAVRHGNKMDPAKKIKIDYLINTDKVEISMTDDGSGFNPKAVPDPRCGENLYKSGGRGLFLIESYMDVVEFNESGNSVRMIKYKQKVSQSE
ncbi:MAG: ATP-binding protein [Planctomycetes bacterium]|nr:ATP-binding protein [Planctomycetota bacterium]MCK5473081.1 ATP-binding protein [Planctomycetota bacterium]